MDIKLKNRLTLATLLLLLTFGLRGAFLGLSGPSDYFNQNYFQTKQFEGQVNEFMGYLTSFELNYISPEEMKKGITVSPEEINEHRYRYGDLGQQIRDIEQQYEQKIHDAQFSGSQSEEIIKAYTKERDTKIEDIKNNFLSDEHVRAKIVKEKEQTIDVYYQSLERSRVRFETLKTEFSYYLKDTNTGKIYTNLLITEDTDVSQVLNHQTMLTLFSIPSSTRGTTLFHDRIPGVNYSDTVEEVLSANEHSFAGQVGVPKDSPAISSVLINYQEYQVGRNFFLIYSFGALAALVLSILLFRRKPQLLEQVAWDRIGIIYERVPFDLRALGFIFSALLTLSFLTQSIPFYFMNSPFQFIRELIFDLTITAILVILTILQGKFWYEKIKTKNWASFREEWKKSLLLKAFNSTRDVFLNRSMGTQVILLLAIVFAFGAGAAGVLMDAQNESFILYVLAFALIGVPTVMVIIKRTGYFNRIVLNTNELVQGNTQVADLPLKGKSSLAVLASNVNRLKNGVKSSQTEQAKSERLKTELITNVSHDLRTPLTSIITYTELLKTTDLSEEDREAYVQIIDRKAKRLKVLIDDLFEATKMASGNIELVKEKVDLVQLLQQALGEYNEAIQKSSLTFRVTTPEHPVLAIVDGQKLWRVFDNLIGNILKYSLENTRVYITLKQLNSNVEISFKNVTKYELGENIDELFERFKRGDTSRHTDGSGLGLAIAKSIIDLHDGNMQIELDGDLFKVVVNLTT